MRRTVMAFLVLAMALRAYGQESPEEAATAAVLIAKDSLLIEKHLPKALSSPHTSFKDNMREEQDAKLLDSCGLGAQSGVAPGCNLSSGDEHLEGGTDALGAGAGLPADYASVFIDDAAQYQYAHPPGSPRRMAQGTGRRPCTSTRAGQSRYRAEWIEFAPIR